MSTTTKNREEVEARRLPEIHHVSSFELPSSMRRHGRRVPLSHAQPTISPTIQPGRSPR